MAGDLLAPGDPTLATDYRKRGYWEEFLPSCGRGERSDSRAMAIATAPASTASPASWPPMIRELIGSVADAVVAPGPRCEWPGTATPGLGLEGAGLAAGSGETVGNSPAGSPGRLDVPGSGCSGGGGTVTGGNGGKEPVPGGDVLGDGPGPLPCLAGAATTTVRAAWPLNEPWAVARPVSLTCSPSAADLPTLTLTCSSSDWPTGRSPRRQTDRTRSGQTVKRALPTPLASAVLAVTATRVLRACTLQIQTANVAACPGVIRDLLAKDCISTHSRGFGWALFEGEGLGLGLGFLLGVGVGVAPGLLPGAGVDGLDTVGDGLGVLLGEGVGVLLGDGDGVAVLLVDGVARGEVLADADADVLADRPERGVFVADALALGRELGEADGPPAAWLTRAEAALRAVLPGEVLWRAALLSTWPARARWCLCRCLTGVPACCASALRVKAGRAPQAVAALCADTPRVTASAPPSMAPDRIEMAPNVLSARRPRCGMFSCTADPPSASRRGRAGSASRSHYPGSRYPRSRWDSPLSPFDTSRDRDGSHLV